MSRLFVKGVSDKRKSSFGISGDTYMAFTVMYGSSVKDNKQYCRLTIDFPIGAKYPKVRLKPLVGGK